MGGVMRIRNPSLVRPNILLALLVAGVLFVLGMFFRYAWNDMINEMNRGIEIGQSRHGFMRVCIEFHTEARCSELDYYDRRDLGAPAGAGG